MKTLQELQKLHVSEQNAQRANLFHKLVTELRALGNEAVTSLLPKLIEVSRYFLNGHSSIFHRLYTCGSWPRPRPNRESQGPLKFQPS